MADNNDKEKAQTPEKKDAASGSPPADPDQSTPKKSNSDYGLMFSFDDQSPQASPRRGAASATSLDSPSNSPRPKKMNAASDFVTQSSPPRFVSFEEIMKAANGVTNMTLAHEIAVDNDFRFQKSDPPPNSMETRVREIMHKAFWDALDEKLREQPPDYSQALVLLQEVKENLLDLMLPNHQRIRGQIEEVLDMELIEQKVEYGAFDILYYAEFVISIMAMLCAPVRDEAIEELTTITEVIPLFKAIFSMLDVLKLDMANFTIQQVRPYIQSQSVDYERTKFQQILDQQKESGRDGLECTKAWINRAGDKVSQQVAAASTGAQSKPVPLSPSAIINTAYAELLEWPENYVFPETLLMDQKRFADLKEKVQWLALVSSVVMVTYNTVGDPIAGVRTFKEKLKNVIAVVIAGIPFENVKDVMPNVGILVAKEVQACLRDHGYPPLVDDRVKMLQGLIEAVASPDQPVHKCLRQRLLSCIQRLLSSPGSRQIQVPPGFAAMAEEFSHVYGQFIRLVSHNRSVFGQYYAEIISTFLEKSAESSSSEPTSS